MSSLPLVELSHKLSGTLLALTSIVNYILIYLTLFHAHNLFGTYRHLIVTFAVFGIFYSCLEFLTKPILHLHKSSLVLFTLESPLRASDFVTTVMLASFTGFHFSILTLLCVQFLYRYWSMFDCRKVRLFAKNRIVYWILGVILSGCLWVFFSYHAMSCDSFSRFYLKSEFWEKYRVDTSYLNCISLVYVDHTDPNETKIRWAGVTYLFVISVLLTTKLSIMMYCGLKMAAKVNKRSNFRSSKHHKQHAYFLKSLFVQLAAPIAIVYLPTLFLSYAPLLNIVISVPSGIIVVLFAIYPAIDGIIVLVIVADYRIALKKAFRCATSFMRNSYRQDSIKLYN
ncbi:unnamed protein product [Caenorhabditis sp. 36 PRJEB53466]|nr:unnamed protein product [Caenorhabditis sp. 36 PRJEB53466]